MAEKGNVDISSDAIGLPSSSKDELSENKCRMYLRNNLVVILVISGVAVGFAIGFGIRPLNPSDDAIMWLGLPGELYMRMLNMMILPLIVCSVIAGAASLDPKSNGRVTLLSLGYIVVTNALACAMAIVLHVIIRPGEGGTTTFSDADANQPLLQTQDIFADLIRSFVPDNIVTACFQQSQTKYTESSIVLLENITGIMINKTVKQLTRTIGTASGTNFLGMLVLIGYTPVGVASLIASSIAGIEDIEGTFRELGMFVLLVTIGIIFHQFVFVPVTYLIIMRKNPITFLLSCSRGWMVAFSSMSTAVSIPETIYTCEDLNGVDKRVSRFVVPFAVTLNGDGSALYITAAMMFLAESSIGLSAGRTFVIWILSTVASMALPAVPSASVVGLIIMCQTLQIPTTSISLLYALEWYLDRIRTTSNLVSHTFCVVFTYRFCKAHLPDAPHTLENGLAVGSKASVENTQMTSM